MEKEERKKRDILTDNRLVTVSKRETSYEGLVSKFENGEDGIYTIITNDKNQIFQPKISITKKDITEIPFLSQLKDGIKFWEERKNTLSGRDAYIAKKTLIDLRKDQYVIKNAYTCPIKLNMPISDKNTPPIDGKMYIDEEGQVLSEGISLANPKICSLILCNYTKIKEEISNKLDTDLWYLIQDFDALAEKAFKNYPIYKKIMIYKINGYTNIEIQDKIAEEFGVRHSIEHISSLWRNKIPSLIASLAADEYLNWYYLNIEKGIYKTCTRCGQSKLAHPRYFSRNKSSKDGFYSICKECRNSKTKGGNE